MYISLVCNSILLKSHSLTVCVCVEKCPSGWHHYEKTSSCYKVYERGENYWQAGETCQRVNGTLATFSTNEELQFILKIDQRVCERRDQCRSVFQEKINISLAFNYNAVVISRFRNLLINIAIFKHGVCAFRRKQELDLSLTDW